MGHIVELVGAPGVGKSTLARALVGRRVGAAGRMVVSAADLLHRPARRLPWPFASMVRRPLDAMDRRGALTAIAPQWQEFLALCAEPRARSSGSDLRRLYADSWLLTTLETMALARQRQDPALVVLDEGLVQRAIGVLGPAPDPERLRRFVATVPCADVVVQLVASEDWLLERMSRRTEEGRVNLRHIGLDAEQLRASLRADQELLGAVVAGLGSRGIRVIRIDTETAVDVLAALEAGLADT